MFTYKRLRTCACSSGSAVDWLYDPEQVRSVSSSAKWGYWTWFDFPTLSFNASVSEGNREIFPRDKGKTIDHWQCKSWQKFIGEKARSSPSSEDTYNAIAVWAGTVAGMVVVARERTPLLLDRHQRRSSLGTEVMTGRLKANVSAPVIAPVGY